MINLYLEDIVSLALDAYLNADGDRNNYNHIADFELQFRRILMQKYCNKTSVVDAQTNHPYIINNSLKTTAELLNG